MWEYNNNLKVNVDERGTHFQAIISINELS